MRAHALTLVLLAPLLLAARPARATGLDGPAAPAGPLAPGALVVTRVALPAWAREFELVLLPETGAPIQVSPELPAGVREVAWRLPYTYGRTARLVVRVGGPGREAVSPPS